MLSLFCYVQQSILRISVSAVYSIYIFGHQRQAVSRPDRIAWKRLFLREFSIIWESMTEFNKLNNYQLTVDEIVTKKYVNMDVYA